MYISTGSDVYFGRRPSKNKKQNLKIKIKIQKMKTVLSENKRVNIEKK